MGRQRGSESGQERRDADKEESLDAVTDKAEMRKPLPSSPFPLPPLVPWLGSTGYQCSGEQDTSVWVRKNAQKTKKLRK